MTACPGDPVLAYLAGDIPGEVALGLAHDRGSGAVVGHVIRVRPDADGYYAQARGKRIGRVDAREEAEAIVRRALNGSEWEIVEEGDQ